MKEKTASPLVEGTWYKFFPYVGNTTSLWFMKCKDPRSYSASNYISWDNSDKAGTARKLYKQGTFGTSYSYHEVSHKELKWLEEVVLRGIFFPIEEFIYDEVINNYPIY